MKILQKAPQIYLWALVSFLVGAYPSNSQVIPDKSLPENSIVPPDCSICIIRGGSLRGQNLFHSFKSFSIPKDGKAHFNNASVVSLVIARVTGKSPTNIDGILSTNFSADLFLMNPNGIIFGTQSSLNVGGSFLGTTASRILFRDGTQFTTSTHNSTSPLTVSTPIGLQFGYNDGIIINRSQHSEPVLVPGFPPFDSPVGLRVKDENTLALIGGNLILDNGRLTSPAGRIELGSVAAFNNIKINKIEKGWDIDYQNSTTFNDIDIVSSTVTVNDFNRTRAGSIEINSSNLTLNNSSNLFAANFGELRGGLITIYADNLNVLGGSAILASAFSSGSGSVEGINIFARDSVAISGTAQDSVSLIASESIGPNKGGNIVIETRKLVLNDGGQILARARRSGNGGSVNIVSSESVNINGVGNNDDGIIPSGLFTTSLSSGDAGNISLNTPELRLNNQGEIGVSSLDSGKAGTIDIIGSSVLLDGQSKLQAEAAQGQGGNISLNLSDYLFMRGGSLISARAGSDAAPGDGGNITIIADDVVSQPNTNSDIFATSFGGRGGVISITARENFFGFVETNDLNPRDSIVNDISVQSTDPDPQLSGQVNITTGEIDPSENLPEQPEIVEPPQEIAKGCRPGQTLGNSSFVHVGRGGLPVGPHQTQTPTTIWQDLRAHNLQSSTTVATDSPLLDTTPPTKIIEAKGWSKDPKGRIHLTANVPQPSLSPQPIATC